MHYPTNLCHLMNIIKDIEIIKVLKSTFLLSKKKHNSPIKRGILLVLGLTVRDR